MNVTVTTNQSWFSRIAGAFGGVVIGLLLIPLSIWALSWNEGRAVQTERSLKEGAGLVKPVPSATVSPANEGKLVHTSGELVIAEPLSDPDFAISASGVRLSRNVEMFQWVEKEEKTERTKLGGGTETVTTYSYAKEWRSEAVDSSGFRERGHDNPPMPVEAREIKAPSGQLGAFTAGDNVLDNLGDAQAVPIKPEQQEAIQAAVGSRPITVSGNYINFSQTAPPAPGAAAPVGPAVGDVRISYSVVPAGQISVVGAQQGDSFAAYQAKAGDQILLVARGNQTAAAMFKSAQDANVMLTWAIRVGGIIALMIGFGMIMAPIGVLADVIPFLGSIARLGTGIVGFVLAIVVGFITIAIAWFAVRPILSLILLAIAAGVFVLFAIYGKKKDKARAAAEAEAPAPA